jgi:DNA repair protein RadD
MTQAPSLKPLRPHQAVSLDGLWNSLATGHRRPILQLPTGAGKTVIAAHVVTRALEKRNRVAFCVPSVGLVDQTFERFVENGIDPNAMGVMQGNHPWRRPSAPIQIATAQTLTRRSLPDSGLVIIDEAHIRFKVYDRWMEEHPERFFVGLTATPWAKGLGQKFDDLVKPTTMRDLIKLGYLSDYRVFAPSHPDLSGVKTIAGDYHEGQLAERMDKPELVADIVNTWLARGENQPTLCFATGRAHAQSLFERFTAAGVSSAYVDANTPREEREKIGERLATGEVKVVCNIGCLTTGIDWDVRCLILARPTKSESLFVQIIGRALRTAEDKQFATILDHSDTHLRLGMVSDIDHDELCSGKPDAKSARNKRDNTKLPVECVQCTALIPVGMRECPSCGFEPKQPIIQEADGDLQELGNRSGEKHKSVRDLVAAMGKRKVYGQLRHIQLERGRQSGWTAHTYRDIFGVWPRGMDHSPVLPPDPKLIAYVRHKDIRFAKSARTDEVSHAA